MFQGNALIKYSSGFKILQKKAKRLVTKSACNWPLSPLFKKSGLLKQGDLFHGHIMLLMHKYCSSILPPALLWLLAFQHDIHSYSSKYWQDVRLHKSNYEILKSSCLYCGPPFLDKPQGNNKIFLLQTQC